MRRYMTAPTGNLFEENMGELDDKVFMKRFSGIIAGLVIITILIIIFSIGNNESEPGANPSRALLAAERVAPVAASRTELPAEESAVVETVAAETPSDPASESGPAIAAATGIDGEAIYNSACMACHATGAADAPIPGSDAWAERVAIGTDALVANAISGVGDIMLPKGGRADLSDDEIRAVVEYMMAQ